LKEHAVRGHACGLVLAGVAKPCCGQLRPARHGGALRAERGLLPLVHLRIGRVLRGLERVVRMRRGVRRGGRVGRPCVMGGRVR